LQQTLARWRIVFLMTAAILFVDNAIFVIFGSTEEQWWNRPKSEGDGDAAKKESPRTERGEMNLSYVEDQE